MIVNSDDSLSIYVVKYFTSRLIYFHEPKASEIKPKSEISSHITLMSVISGLFHTRYFTGVVFW